MVEPVITWQPFQRRWLEDKSRFKIGMFARQTGKTFTTSAEIVDDCVQHMIAQRRTRWVILSRSERQAKEAVDAAIKPLTRAYYAIYNAVKRGYAEPELEEGTFRVERENEVTAEYKMLDVIYPGGSRITAVPANPDTARGFSANLFLDEFAIHQNSREIWAAAFPIISSRGWKLRVTSTPKGKKNKFYDLITSSDPVWSRHVCDIHQAVAEGLDRDVAALKAALNDQAAWEQEFELKFLEDFGSVLPMDWITACEDEAAGTPDAYQGGPCFVGNDIARRGHLWVTWVMELVGDVLVCRELIVERGISFAEQDAIIAGVMRRYRVVRLFMDQTGMGEKPVEDAKRHYGNDRVVGMLFTPANKLDMATTIRRRFEERRTRIPMGDDELREDLNRTKRMQGPGGSVTLQTDDDEAGHADRFWALALAMMGADGGVPVYAYTPAYGRTERDRRHEDDADRRHGRARFGRGAW